MTFIFALMAHESAKGIQRKLNVADIGETNTECKHKGLHT